MHHQRPQNTKPIGLLFFMLTNILNEVMILESRLHSALHGSHPFKHLDRPKTTYNLLYSKPAYHLGFVNLFIML